MQGITATPCTLKEILQEVIADLKARTEAANYCEEVNDMTEAAKAARRAYKKKWQQENADKVKEYQRRYWEKKAREEEQAADAEPARG